MNVQVMKTLGTKVLSRGLLLARKHAPEILTGLGIVGGVTAGVLAVKATSELLKNDEMKEARDLRDTIELVKEARDLDETNGTKILKKKYGLDSYSDADYKKDVVVSYVKKLNVLIKRYAVPIALGTASITCILAAHGLMRTRNASLVVAYNTLDAAYKAYRKRVVEELGEEKDWDIANGIREEVVETLDESTGKTKKSKTLVPTKAHSYSRFFDENNKNWNPTSEELNHYFLMAQQTYANDRLHARGHLFLSEVFDDLGLERTPDSIVVGWLLDKDGDNFVDFGLYDLDDPKSHGHLSYGTAKRIPLDFNVDGIIFDKI